MNSDAPKPPRVLPSMRKRQWDWRVLHFFHNFVVHPLLPLAEALDNTKHQRVADEIFRLHDMTAQEGDDHRYRSV